MNAIVRSPRNKQRGQMGIIGAILGLVVIGLVLYYVLNHFGAAKDTQGGQAMASDFSIMAGKAQARFRNDANGYANVDSAGVALINNGVIPQNYVSNNTVVTPFGVLTFAPADPYGTGVPGTGLSFNYPQVPSSACSDFVSAIQGGAVEVTVGGTTVKSPTSPFNAVTLGTSCKGGGTNSSVAVVATIGK